MKPIYFVFGNPLSYFTRKLEAAMDFYGAHYQSRRKSPEVAAEIESRSGTHQVPVLQTPENWMIADTTPLMMMLDVRYPLRAMFPPGELGLLVHIVEDYFDEWIARTMVHYRWHYPDSAAFASLKMSDGNEAVAARVRDWGPRACRATGTDSEVQQRAAESEYLRILQAAEKQLHNTSFLLGDRPCAVDCIVLGGLRAHTNMDPDPKVITQTFTRVVEWSETLSNRWSGTGELAPFPESTPFARFILEEMKTTYVPYMLGNRDAQLADAKAFKANIYGEDVSFLSRPYPVQALQMITQRLRNQLTDEQRELTWQWLDTTGLQVCFRGLV